MLLIGDGPYNRPVNYPTVFKGIERLRISPRRRTTTR